MNEPRMDTDRSTYRGGLTQRREAIECRRMIKGTMRVINHGWTRIGGLTMRRAHVKTQRKGRKCRNDGFKISVYAYVSVSLFAYSFSVRRLFAECS